MEGPVILVVCGALTLLSVWFYTRFFQTLTDRSPELEVASRKRTLLATLSVREGSEAEVDSMLKKAIGSQKEITPTLGGWPWTLHAIRVAIESSPGRVDVRMIGCRPRRTREKDAPALTDVLLSSIESSSANVRDTWLLPALYVDVSGRSVSKHGWRVVPGVGRKRPCRPRESGASADESVARSVVQIATPGDSIGSARLIRCEVGRSARSFSF